MSSFLRALRNLLRVSIDPARDRDDRYLADASDICDLERRMREIDSGRHHLYAIGSYGILMRRPTEPS